MERNFIGKNQQGLPIQNSDLLDKPPLHPTVYRNYYQMST